MEMEVYFPGNQKVNATYKGFTIATDQPESVGGDGTAPAPFDLFLTSIGTCAGIQVIRFMQQRGLDTSGAGLRLSFEHDREAHLVSKVHMEIKLPPDFPEKYRDAIIRVADQCAVKRHLHRPPAFDITTATG